MALIDFYVPLRQAHLIAVALSLTLFAVRGVGVLAGHRWPMQPGPRRLSVAIDIVLLCCGAALWVALGLNPVRDTWLGAKLALLLVYIGLGSYALKRAATRRARAVFFFAALLCAAYMVSMARAHHPGGIFHHERTGFSHQPDSHASGRL